METVKAPNFVPLNVQVNDIEFPEEIRKAKGVESLIAEEWIPKQRGEWLAGRLLSGRMMSKGGMAYVIMYAPGKMVLLKHGGAILTSRFADLGVEYGDMVAMIYLGEGEAKHAQNPPRLWKIKKLVSVE